MSISSSSSYDSCQSDFLQENQKEIKDEIRVLKQAVDDTRNYFKEQIDDLRRTLDLIAQRLGVESRAGDGSPNCEVEDGHSGEKSSSSVESRERSPIYEESDIEGDAGSEFDIREFDSQMNELLSADRRCSCPCSCEPFFTSFDKVHDDFLSMGLKNDLLNGIFANGFPRPSVIQQKAIVPFCQGLDVIGQAQSGTGKTVAFCVGILQRVDLNLLQCQALVLAPTMELAQQIERVMRALGKYLGVKVQSCVDETSDCELEKGVQVVVGNIDPVLNMLQRQSLRPDYIKMFVLDEADEMLSPQLRDQVYDIFQFLPANLQVGFFSATMPPEALEITRRFMTKPVTILVKRDELISKGIKQFYVDFENEEGKLEAVCDIYRIGFSFIAPVVIFVKNNRKVEWLADKMRSRGIAVCATHVGMDKKRRETMMSEFHSGSVRVLVTTGLLARGMDFQEVYVVNYDLPTRLENYLHRIGRCGRFGRIGGVAINFVTRDDTLLLDDIERFFNVVIEELSPDFDELKLRVIVVGWVC